MQGTKYITDITPVPDKIELTNNFTNISDYNGIDAYYIGWTNVPTFMNVYNMRYTESVFASEKVTSAENAVFTWGSNYSTSSVGRYITYTMQKANSLSDYNSCAYRLVNKLDCGNINTHAPVIDVGFIGNVTKPDDPNYGITPLWSIEMRARQFGGGDDTDAVLEDLNSNTTLNFDVVVDLPWYGINSKRFVVEYSMADLRPGYYEIDMTSDGVRLFGYVYISGIWLQGARAFYESWDTPVSMDGYPELYPIVKNGDYLIGSNFAPYNTPLIIRWDVDSYPRITSGGIHIDSETTKVLGCYEGLSILNNGNSSTPLWYYYDWVEKNGNCICRNVTRNGTDRIIHIFYYIPVSDINTFIKMFPRLEGKGAPIYNESFEPTDEWSDDPADLAPWQSDITKNDYDGEIPENYQEEPTGDSKDMLPGEIDPMPKEDSGNVPLNLTEPDGFSSFITNYLLTSAQLKTFGTSLWSSINAPDPTQKYQALTNFYSLSDSTIDFYFSNADILDFIVSVRWYPLNLDQIVTCYNSNTIKLGSGSFPYSINGIKVLQNGLAQYHYATFDLSAYGSNTFLDYEPVTSMSLFIPFCGSLELQPSIVVGKSISIDMYVDLNTGTCTAYVAIISSGGRIPYACISGNIGFDVLLTSNNAQTLTAKAYMTNNTYKIEKEATFLGGVSKSVSSGANPLAVGSTIADTYNELTKMRKENQLLQPTLTAPTPMISSNFSSLASLGYIHPYIIARYHTAYNNGADYSKVGYICDKYKEIGVLQGGTFFSCNNPKIDNIPCTTEEADIIISALTDGCFK